jgi:hypothetical protein
MTAQNQPSGARATLLTLISKYVGREAVTDDTELYRDLSLVGDDAYEFLAEFARLFSISGFERLHFDDYFPSEGWNLFLPRWFGVRDKRRGRITISHLLNVVENRSWLDPPIQDRPAFGVEVRDISPSLFWIRIVTLLTFAIAAIVLFLSR